MKKKTTKLAKTKDIDKSEGTFAIVASLLVLFSCILDPLVSAITAFILMLGYGIYKIGKIKWMQ